MPMNVYFEPDLLTSHSFSSLTVSHDLALKPLHPTAMRQNLKRARAWQLVVKRPAGLATGPDGAEVHVQRLR